MGAYIWLEEVRKILFEQITIDFTHVFFIEFLGLTYHVYQGAYIVDEESEYNTAHNLNKGAKKSLKVV